MKKNSNIKIRTKLYLGFAVLILFSIFIGISSLYSIRSVNEKSGLIDSSNQLIIMILEARRQEKNFQLRGFEKFGNDKKNSAEKWQDWVNSIYKETGKIKADVSGRKNLTLIQNIKDSTEKYETTFKEYISYIKNKENNPKKENSINSSLVSSARAFQENCENFIKIQKTLNIETTERINYLMLALIICAIIAGGIIGTLISKSLVKTISILVNQVSRLSKGDLTAKNNLTNSDELGLLCKELDNTIDNLRNLLQNIKLSIQQLILAIDEISKGNENLSMRTSSQASSLEQIVASIESANNSISQNVISSNGAQNKSNITSMEAEKSEEVLNKSQKAMMEIHDSSKQILNIINLLNDISFQTNLLALNAAVEAARAGEHGRGFAVVASEVRNLALSSASSAKEMKLLLEKVTDQINNGVKNSIESGDALKSIIVSIKEIDKMITNINRESNEQQQGMSQIHLAINELDSNTQQNAALVEEISSASMQMSSHAKSIIDLIDVFTIIKSEKKLLEVKN
jgi:methyl-accepting chemotaxis protein